MKETTPSTQSKCCRFCGGDFYTKCVDSDCPCHRPAHHEGLKNKLVNLLYDYGNACVKADRDVAARIKEGEIIDEIEALFLSSKPGLGEVVDKLEKMKMENTKEESTSDWFYGYGWNSAIATVLSLLEEINKPQ